MIRRSSLVVIALLSGLTSATAQDRTRLPNIVLIVADDLGCFELGCYGQKHIKTPHLDRLAASGMKFTRFYAGNAVCAPSRCCLMTGRHPGHATVRDNKESKGEGQFPLRVDDVTIAELLKARGYTCGAIGKWGLGMFDTPGSPLEHGFESFYGYNCQRHAHSHYPKFLYRNADRIDLPGNNLKGGDNWSHDLFEKESLAFLETNAKRPFFLYLPFALPHVALQAPDDAIAEYRGKLGEDPAYDGKKGYQAHPTPHAGYAAMVTRMDRTVGRIVAKLTELKIDGETLILFTSDNGPTHNVGGADSTFFQSAGTLRGLKGSLYEGGLRVPMIAMWPGKIKPSSTDDSPHAFWDLLPTFVEIAGGVAPKNCDGISFLPTLYGQPQRQHEFLYWEFPGYGGQQALLVAEWKAIRQQLKSGQVTTQLFNLKDDPSETRNLAKAEPKRLMELEVIMTREHVSTKDFPLPAIDKP